MGYYYCSNQLSESEIKLIIQPTFNFGELNHFAWCSNAKHIKPDLGVFFRSVIYRSGSVITDFMPSKFNAFTSNQWCD